MTAEFENPQYPYDRVTTMPTREEVHGTPDTMTPQQDPAQVPWLSLVPTTGPAPILPEDTLCFGLLDGRTVHLTVPSLLSEADAAFIASVTTDFVKALARRIVC